MSASFCACKNSVSTSSRKGAVRQESGEKVKKGRFDIYKGRESTLKSGKDFDLQAGKEGNVADRGSGQIGKILLDIQWNRIFHTT